MKRIARGQHMLSADTADEWWFAESPGGVTEAAVSASPSAPISVGTGVAAAALAPPSDSLFGSQWHLTGTWGINVLPVWDDYTGAGVTIAVFDSGVDWTHPDLAERVDQTHSIDSFTGGPGGLPITSDDNHGTAVAGLIAASRNGSGVVGVAYDATLLSIYQSFDPFNPGNNVTGFDHARQYADVMNNSWGYIQNFGDDFGADLAADGAALRAAAEQGRDGLGTIIVQAGGNQRLGGGNTNLHDFTNDRHVITVAATGTQGIAADYSNQGTSTLVAAPGGRGGTDAVTTTDRPGDVGYVSGDYTTTFTGTSAAAPLVSGVVALMLEANPGLGYRDVQEILALSARQTLEPGDYEYNGAANWNGGGLHFSDRFGAGLVDARAAVRLAETWATQHTAANEQGVTMSASPGSAITDHSTVTTTFSNFTAIDIDFVEVYVNISHSFRGDLSIFLDSPSGLTTVLTARPYALTSNDSGMPDPRDDIVWTFGTPWYWGEDGVGTWRLRVQDSVSQNTGTLNSVEVRLYGDTPATDDTYVYTDEFNEMFSRDATHATQRAMLNDTDGGIDTLNGAALTGAAIIRLDGGDSTIDGHAIMIAAGIENAFAGDGNDTLGGTTGVNTLYGGRGDDLFIADIGDDRLDGGKGSDLISFAAAIDRIEADIAAATIGGAGALGTDTLISIEGVAGGAGDDWLRGSSDANLLIGGAGLDTLDGGAGDDTYDVDSAADVVLEAEGGGRDLVRSAIDYILTNPALEDLALYGAAGLWATGNQGDNRLYGSELNNTLQGLGGIDSLFGAGGNDWLLGGEGNDLLDGGLGLDHSDGGNGDDTYYVDQSSDLVVETGSDGRDTIISTSSYTSVSGIEILILSGAAAVTGSGSAGDDTIFGNIIANALYGQGGHDVLYGGLHNDTLYGGEGNDLLDGGSGNDRLEGGTGDDRYIVDSSAVIVIEGVGGGVDTIVASVSTVLGTEFENLTLTGSTSTNGIGNAFANVMFGNSAGNSLSGGDGDDALDGGGGADRLFGGAGNDLLTIDVDDAIVDGGDGEDTAILGSSADSLTHSGWAGIERYELRGGDDVFLPSGTIEVPGTPPASISLSNLNGTNGFAIHGGGANKYLGWSVAGVGDVNNDGLDDFVATGPGETFGSSRPTFADNRSFLVFGKTGPWNSDWVPWNQPDDGTGVRLSGRWGQFVDAAGDVNGDGIDDLVIGSSTAEGGVGAAYVIFGKPGSWPQMLSDTELNGSNGFKIVGSPGERVGSSGSTAGDFNGDGIGDLILGVPDDDETRIVFGHAGPWSPTLSTSSLTGADGMVLKGVQDDGAVSNAGDVNGDGLDDVLVAGVAQEWFLVYGRNDQRLSIDVRTLDGTTGTRFVAAVGAVPDKGRLIAAAGDINGDGIDDFVLGAPSAGIPSFSPGAVYVVFGNPAGWGATFDVRLLAGTNGGAILGQTHGGGFGMAVNAVGDMDSDGFDDLIIGANGQGAARILFGHGGAWASSVTENAISADLTTRLAVSAEDAGRWSVDAGWSVDGIGDINGDGAPDVVVGAPHASRSFEHEGGAAYVVFGWPTTTAPIADKAFVVDGGEGNDTISGRSLADRLTGGAGNDVMSGGAAAGGGYNLLYGGDGVDMVSYAWTSSAVYADLNSTGGHVGGVLTDIMTGVENLRGGGGADVLVGDSSANRLDGGAGDSDDLLFGGVGNDVFVGDGHAAASFNQLWGGDGLDTADYSTEAGRVFVDLRAPAGHINRGGGFVLNDLMNSVENVLGGSNDDILAGTDGANLLSGSGGADLLFGFGGDDVLVGGTASAGNYNQLWGDSGSDTASYEFATTTVYADLRVVAGWVDSGGSLILNDVYNSIENLMGGSGADSLAGNDNDNRLIGGIGADLLYGFGGNDTFVYRSATESNLATGYDSIADFESGGDKLDLTALGVTSGDVSIVAAGGFTSAIYVNTDGVIGYDLALIVTGTTASIQMSDILL